ncbi:accelerated cell death 11 [Aegilops tauschii subsp. strangulata]|uniref:accelerated cell death 11 n=1 Tax=Aegilops tauschii subsp. strangulata TaxID=200361 RepID=UPI00098A09DA|nr:accelerated cell death 11 [Aegilops tauschii subsp. strangulata]
MPMGSNEADKPLRRIGASFEQLAVVSKQQQPAMAAGDFSRACSNVSVLFCCLGIAFKFAEMDYVAKVAATTKKTPNSRTPNYPTRACHCSCCVKSRTSPCMLTRTMTRSTHR